MAIGQRMLGALLAPATALPLLAATVAPGLSRLAAMPPRSRPEPAARR